MVAEEVDVDPKGGSRGRSVAMRAGLRYLISRAWEDGHHPTSMPVPSGVILFTVKRNIVGTFSRSTFKRVLSDMEADGLLVIVPMPAKVGGNHLLPLPALASVPFAELPEMRRGDDRYRLDSYARGWQAAKVDGRPVPVVPDSLRRNAIQRRLIPSRQRGSGTAVPMVCFMERQSLILEAGEACTDALANVPTASKALDTLEDRGYVDKEPGRGHGWRYRSVRPYRALRPYRPKYGEVPWWQAIEEGDRYSKKFH